MKKIIALAAGVVLLGLLVAGLLCGPRLRERYGLPAVPPVRMRPALRATPMGQVIRLETVQSFGPSGLGEVRAVPGYRLWVVHFKPLPGPAGTGGQESSLDWLHRSLLIDDRGAHHGASMLQEAFQFEQGAQVVSERALVFSIPRERQPWFLRFASPFAVRLPAPSEPTSR